MAKDKERSRRSRLNRTRKRQKKRVKRFGIDGAQTAMVRAKRKEPSSGPPENSFIRDFVRAWRLKR